MEIDARKPEGNAFAIMATVRRLLIDSGRGDEWPAIEKRMIEGHYETLCAVAEEVTYGSIVVINQR